VKKLLLASALLLAAGSIHAVESVRWDNASLSYQTVDSDGSDLSGFSLSGMKLINDNVFITGGYSSVSGDESFFDIDFTSLAFGFGYRHAHSKTTDFFGVASILRQEVDISSSFGSIDDSESGFDLQAGIRSLVNPNIELSGALRFVDIADDTETGLNLSAMYHFTEQYSAGISYDTTGDADTINLSAILFF